MSTSPASEPLPPLRCAAPARVERVTHPCREHVALELVAPECPPSVPGQFVQLNCRSDPPTATADHDWPPDGFPSIDDADFLQREPFLRRPFSIADRYDEEDGAHLLLISRAVGVGTRWLDRLQRGDELDFTGPLGRGFSLPQHPRRSVLVGGGVGIPPLLYLARTLHALRHTDVTCIFGATSADLLPLRLFAPPAGDARPSACVELPGGASYPVLITTDDGSLGLAGRVTDGLRRLAPGVGADVYACGPEPMLRAVAELTRDLGCACQLCVERNMGCGIGTCLSCVIRVRDAGRPGGWRWALTCTDGPVFPRDELLDFAPGQRA